MHTQTQEYIHATRTRNLWEPCMGTSGTHTHPPTSTPHHRCASTGKAIPKDKAVTRFIVRNIVDASSMRDIRDASAYEAYALPKLYIKQVWLDPVSCACVCVCGPPVLGRNCAPRWSQNHTDGRTQSRVRTHTHTFAHTHTVLLHRGRCPPAHRPFTVGREPPQP